MPNVHSRSHVVIDQGRSDMPGLMLPVGLVLGLGKDSIATVSKDPVAAPVLQHIAWMQVQVHNAIVVHSRECSSQTTALNHHLSHLQHLCTAPAHALAAMKTPALIMCHHVRAAAWFSLYPQG